MSGMTKIGAAVSAVAIIALVAVYAGSWSSPNFLPGFVVIAASGVLLLGLILTVAGATNWWRRHESR